MKIAKNYILIIIIGFFGIVHLVAYSIKSKIRLILESSSSDNQDVLYDGLVLNNHGVVINLILVLSALLFVIFLLHFKKRGNRYYFLISLMYTALYIALEFLLYKYYW